VVKVRVTSHQRLRVRIPPVTRVAVAQMAEQWKTPEPIVPAAKIVCIEPPQASTTRNSRAARPRDGEEESYFVSRA
jgi:hypothetical protein